MACCLTGSDVLLWAEPGASSYTWDASSELTEFISHALGKTETRAQSEGIRGERSRFADQDRLVQRVVGGSLVLPASTDLHDRWLTRIVQGTESTNVWIPAEVETPFGLCLSQFDDYFIYSDCQVNRATWRGSSGGLVTLTLDILGLTETQASSDPSSGNFDTTFPSATIATQQLRMGESTLNVASTEYEMEDFELTIDNFIVARYANSLDATCLVATDRMITLRTTLAACADLALHALGDETDPTSVTLTLTNDSVSTAFVMANMYWPQNTPPVPGKQLLNHPITMEAKKVGTTAALIITNDNTV